MVSLYRKLLYLNKAEVKGVMGSWNFGLFTDTLNLFAFNKFRKKSYASQERAWLISLATEYFGQDVDADKTIDAWYGFQKAVQYYPINGSKFVYYSPINYALSYLLKSEFSGEPMGFSCEPPAGGDHLEDSFGSFTLEQVVDLLKRLSSEWFKACDLYKEGLWSAKNTQNKEKEFGVALTAGCCFRSTYNIYRWYLQRKENSIKMLTAGELQIITDEIANLERVLPCVEADKRLGYHQECNCYMFSAAVIKTKLKQLNDMLQVD